MRFRGLDEIRRLVQHGVAESPSLEYKREMSLRTAGEKLELLKDLTAMGNGGGGTVIYGVEEGVGDWPVAGEITSLQDRSLVARVEDIVRDGTRPPLLFDLSVIEVDDGGYVLAADIEPSPLGPYMVQTQGNFRYHRRIGRRTEPMGEQQVRDAYALAARSRDHRQDLWQAHALPIQPPTTGDPWLAVSALPEEPLIEILDVGTVDPQMLLPTAAVNYHMNQTGLLAATNSLNRWADGFFGHDGTGDSPPFVSVRLHRDGAAGITRRLIPELSGVFTARLVNAQLSYLSHFWERFGLRRPVEVVIELSLMQTCSLETGTFHHNKRVIPEPPGVPVTGVVVKDHILPWELARASVRHRLVRRFVDHLYQAFGLARSLAMFSSGQLYRHDAGPLGFSVAGGGVWDHQGAQLAFVYDNGSVFGAKTGVLRAWWDEGCLLDLVGDTLGVVELASGHGTPDDYLPSRLLDDPRAKVPGGNAGSAGPAPQAHAVVSASGRWNAANPNPAEYFQA